MKINPPSGDIASPFAERNAAASLPVLKGRQRSLHWMVCLVAYGAAEEHFHSRCRVGRKKPAWFSLKENHTARASRHHGYCENALDRTVLPRLLDDWHL